MGMGKLTKTAKSLANLSLSRTVVLQVAGLSWIERKVANTLFGEVPQGTYKDAINSMLEAERLNPNGWKENRLLLSKCYIAEQVYKQALYWLDSAKDIPAISAEVS